MVVPAGAGAGGQPISQASLPPGPSSRIQVRPSGSSGSERMSSESAAVRRTKSRSRLAVGAAERAGAGAGRGAERDMMTVRNGSRGRAARQPGTARGRSEQHERGPEQHGRSGTTQDSPELHGAAQARRGKCESAGRATHAARIADEVHMDPPPQAHIGVGHAPQYTMCAQDGQLTSAVLSSRTAVAAPPRAASAASYSSAGRTPLKAATRCPSGRTSSTVCAEAPG